MEWIDNRLTVYADKESDLQSFLNGMAGDEDRQPWASPEDVAKRIYQGVVSGMTPKKAVMTVCKYESSAQLLDARDSMEGVSRWLDGMFARIDTLERDCSPVFGSPGKKPFSFARGCPIPHEVYQAGKALGGIPWCKENWGTRYDAIKPAVEESGWKESVRGYVGVVTFITVDSPPEAFIQFIAQKYRDMIFSLVSFDYVGKHTWGAVAYQDDSMDFSHVVDRYKGQMVVDHGGEFSYNTELAEKHSATMAKALINRRNKVHQNGDDV